MTTKKTPSTNVTISPPNMQTAEFVIVGTEPLMIARFAKKAEMMAKMQEGKTAGSRRARPARDFEKDCEEATYRNEENGWSGVNASSFRNAMISACRLVGFKMTLAKLSIFVEADGYDYRDMTPLCRIYGADGEDYKMHTGHTRNATGVIDIRARPMWKPGWKIKLRIRFDADQFRAEDVANLLSRVGSQGGIGEGRPDSKSSAGMGFGLFRLGDESDFADQKPKARRRKMKAVA